MAQLLHPSSFMLHPCPCRSARRSPQPARLPDNLSPRRSFSQVKVSSTFLLSIRRKMIMRRLTFVFAMAIEVPSGADLDVETHFGEVHLEGTFGNVDVDMNAGEIHMTTPRASVRELAASCRVGEVHANLGDKIVDREGLFPGTTHFTNPNGGKGDVRLHVTAGGGCGALITQPPRRGGGG